VIAAIVLSQFTELKRLATGILASTAVLGLIIGFAAQHTIANMVAGVQLAVTQRSKSATRSASTKSGARDRHHALLYLRRPR